MLQTKQQNRPADIDRKIVETSSFPPAYVEMVVQRTVWGVLKGREALKTEALGVHGIGSITLFDLLKTGRLPTGRSPGNEGNIYLYPFSSANLDLPGLGLLAGTNDAAQSDSAAIERAAGYASGNSELLYKANILELDLATPEGWEIASQLRACDNELCAISDDIFARARVSRGNARKVASLFPGLQRGFLVFVGKSAIDDHTYRVGDLDEGDIKLDAPDGLSLRHCIAIQPLTGEDAELIERLPRAWIPS